MLHGAENAVYLGGSEQWPVNIYIELDPSSYGFMRTRLYADLLLRVVLVPGILWVFRQQRS